jgi:hypothetical protein
MFVWNNLDQLNFEILDGYVAVATDCISVLEWFKFACLCADWLDIHPIHSSALEKRYSLSRLRCQIGSPYIKDLPLTSNHAIVAIELY